MDGVAYQLALGRELLALRLERHWTRAQLVQRLPSGLSAQAVASYEAGTRACTVERFVELCEALDMSPHDLLDRVQYRMAHEGVPSSLHIDLRALVDDGRSELLPARRWAETELAHHAEPMRDLELAALESLATLCGVQVVELIRMLRAERA